MEHILNKIEKLALTHDAISPQKIREKNIKLGLRNEDGTGVIVGITSKGEVVGYEKVPNEDGSVYTVRPADGKLYYCGYDVGNLVREIHRERRFGYEEIVFLLLTGELPIKENLERLRQALYKRRHLTRAERSILMQESENDNLMYALHSVVSHLSRCDKNPDSSEMKDASLQCFNLIAKMPTIVAYVYHAMRFRKGSDLMFIRPVPHLSMAENFLYMLKGEKPDKYEAYLFDMAMMLHAEHGGGNNSTFTVRTVSSSGANTYMAICSGIASLSGHLHGGANEAVMAMMKDIQENVRDWNDDEEIRSYLIKILDGKAGDGTGKIYGMGHAVYTLSDPRAVILRELADEYSQMKGALEEFALLDKVAIIARKLLKKKRGRAICANVDFYSGFIYKLMGIPDELFTPIFAMSRVTGWSAHRIEQILQNKIIRPGYLSSLKKSNKYTPLNKRQKGARALTRV